MLIKTGVGEELQNTSTATPDDIIGPKLRVWAVAKGLLLQWRDQPHLLFDLYLFGEAAFIRVMRRTMRPDSMAAGLTDAQLGEVFAHVESFVKKVAAHGKWRRRKGETMTQKEYADWCRERAELARRPH